MHLKSCLRSPASRSVVSIRPWGGLLFSRAVGISTPGSISWWKPRYSSIFAAATLPAAMARMTVAGPVTQSPPAEDAVHIVDLAAGLGDERAALDGDLRLLKAVGLHALTDGDNDNVRRDALFAALGLFGRGAALFIHLADDLRLCPQRDGVTVRIGLDADWCLKRHELHALGNGALHFSGRAVMSSWRRR